MRFIFPTKDVLKTVLLDGTLGDRDLSSPCWATTDGDAVHVTPQHITDKGKNALGKRGIACDKRMVFEPLYRCWAHVLPLEKTPLPDLEKRTVVIDAPAAAMARIVHGKPAPFAFFDDAEENPRVLIRLTNPDLLTVLRADGADDIYAYLEQSKGVWVQAGWRHPCPAAIPQRDALWLLDARDWRTVSVAWQEPPTLKLDVAQALTTWQAAQKNTKVPVTVRLRRTVTTEPAELWLLPCITSLHDFVRATDDKLLSRFSFVFEKYGDAARHVLLRLNPSRKDPVEPNLLKTAVGFRPLLKLPNLFAPLNETVHPALRRDALRDLFAPDMNVLTWLMRGANGMVTNKTPLEGFKNLSDWVNYSSENPTLMQSWASGGLFATEPFTARENAPAPEPKEPKGKTRPPEAPAPKATMLPMPKVTKRTAPVAPAAEPAQLVKVEPSQLRVRLTELEKQFEAMTEPLDDPARLPLWRDMAALNAALDKPADAAVCWLNSAWTTDDADYAPAWVKAEQATSIAAVLNTTDPLPTHLRQLAALVLHNPKDAAGKLPKITAFLDAHDGRLPIRAVWLVRQQLAKLAGDDVLALARARDRMLDRLVKFGLTPEYDLPAFMRFLGQQGGDRFRVVRDRVAGLRAGVHKWVAEGHAQNKTALPTTLAYVDLIFAFGLAKLGETSPAQSLVKDAHKALHGKDEIHTFLNAAYAYRIQQALAGDKHGGPFPTALQEQLKALTEKKGTDTRVSAYIVGRLRGDSRILEPHDKVDAYREWRKSTDALGDKLETIYTAQDKALLDKELTKLIGAYPAPGESLRVLSAALHVAGNLTEAMADRVLSMLLARRGDLAKPADTHGAEANAKILERALFLAAHWDRGDVLQRFVAVFFDLLNNQQGSFTEAVDALAQCLRGLRKLGLHQEIDGMLGRMHKIILKDKTLAAVKAAARNNDDWADILRALQPIAAGWLHFGQSEKAMPILAEAQALLFAAPENKPAVVKRARLARAYAEALGQAPVDLGLEKFAELFQKLGGLTDTFTTNSHFSLSQLQVVEAVMRSVVNDDFAMGANVRRWLDEDEYLVRKRIHADLRMAMNKAGV